MITRVTTLFVECDNCHRRFSLDGYESMVLIRIEAAKRGWTYIPRSALGVLSRDICPSCSAQAE